jgi:hypothetical protein
MQLKDLIVYKPRICLIENSQNRITLPQETVFNPNLLNTFQYLPSEDYNSRILHIPWIDVSFAAHFIVRVNADVPQVILSVNYLDKELNRISVATYFKGPTRSVAFTATEGYTVL